MCSVSESYNFFFFGCEGLLALLAHSCLRDSIFTWLRAPCASNLCTLHDFFQSFGPEDAATGQTALTCRSRQQIQSDIEEVGMAMAKLLPATQELQLKLELIGENCCSRWHQDHYTCRAIVSYNCCGTDYVRHDNVNFWELENRGKNDSIIRDPSQIFTAEVGDIVLMKGKTYPSSMNGLVHKSPEKRYHANGAIVTRLVLKLDVE